MSPKTKSILVEKVNTPPVHWIIRGNTRPIKDALLAGGAIWDDKLVLWKVMSSDMPDGLGRAIADVLGEGGPLVEDTRSTREKFGGGLSVGERHLLEQIEATLVADQPHFEPDGQTSTYSIEETYGLSQGDDWLAKRWSILADDLPERQVEFLQALVSRQPVVKNAATRLALKRRRFIHFTEGWDDIVVLDAGWLWLRVHDAIPALPLLSLKQRAVLEHLYKWRLPNKTDSFVVGSLHPDRADIEYLVSLGYLQSESVLEPDDTYSLTAAGCKAIGKELPEIVRLRDKVAKTPHIEPDGTDNTYAIEARYGVGQGEDWLTVYHKQRAIEPSKPDSTPETHNTHYVSKTPAKPVKSAFGKRVTPIRQQYLDLKAQHEDKILLFRLGDFYEAFEDDAHKMAAICDLVLTTRPINKDERVPMAGVPHRALDQYVNMLTAAGHTVAVAEQTGQYVPGTGAIERTVTRIVKPGDAAHQPLDESPASLVLEWTTQEISIKNRSTQSIPVQADVCGQVAVHPELLHGGTFSSTHWTLTHILSGMVILSGDYKQAELKELAEMLGGLDIDQWWQNKEQGIDDRTDEKIVAIIDQQWGRRKPDKSTRST